MTNKLKELLDQSESYNVLELYFSNEEECLDFQHKIHDTITNGRQNVIPIPERVDYFNSLPGEQKYLLDTKSKPSIISGHVFSDYKKLDLSLGDKVECYHLVEIDRELKKWEVDFSNIIKVYLMFGKEECRINYSLYPEETRSLVKVIKEIERFLHFIKCIFKEENMHPEFNDTVKYFLRIIDGLRRAKEVCEKLKIELSPIQVFELNRRNGALERLYLLLIRKKIIRKNQSIDNMEIPKRGQLQIGNQLSLIFTGSEKVVLGDRSIKLYEIYCSFGAEIVDIKHNGENDIVYFKKSEKNPMYISYSAFLSEDEVDAELDKVKTKLEQYRNAATFDNLLRDLLTADYESGNKNV